MVGITGFRQILWYKYTTDMRLLKKAGSMPWMLATSLFPGYMLAFWFMTRMAMNEPDVSWARKNHNFFSWSTVRPNYMFQLWEPYRENLENEEKPPSFELPAEYKERQI